MKNDSPPSAARLIDLRIPPSARASTATVGMVAMRAPDSARTRSLGPIIRRATANAGCWRIVTSVSRDYRAD